MVNMRKCVIDKKGQQLTLSTLILIVLGVAVLVFLIFGFSTGWNTFWNKITAFGGGSSNVDTIKQACALVCSTQSEYAFCDEERTVKYGKDIEIIENDVAKKVNSEDGNCKDFIDNKNVNVEECPGLCP